MGEANMSLCVEDAPSGPTANLRNAASIVRPFPVMSGTGSLQRGIGLMATNKVAFFNGQDPGGFDHWVSDGSVAGTFEIGGLDSAVIADANTATGLNATSTLTAFQTAYFEGVL